MAKKIEKQVRRRFRRNCSANDLYTAGLSHSLRNILDRSSKGLPCNTKLREHIPLPPDGEDMEDFDTGTTEYLDIVDVQPVLDKINELEALQKEAQQKAQEQAMRDKIMVELAQQQQQQAQPEP